jgi:hypothetical protein
MQWYHYLAYFAGGAFWVSAVPHLTNGVSGRPFPCPLGESSPVANVVWAAFNLFVAYVLTCQVGQFRIRGAREMAIAALGGLLMALWLATTFATDPGGASPCPTCGPAPSISAPEGRHSPRSGSQPGDHEQETPHARAPIHVAPSLTRQRQVEDLRGTRRRYSSCETQ